MYDTIKNFNKQFIFKPEIENMVFFKRQSGFVVVGMGGSALAALLLKTWKPTISIIIHSNYGLPELSTEECENKTTILSSYSGNTEEVIDAFKEAKKQNLNIVVISTGGKLLALARENKTPYIELPNTGIQPRSALGFSIKAFLKFMGEEKELKKIGELAETLNPTDYEKDGKTLAIIVKNHIPVIYASSRNLSLAYIWKIKINETGKIPAFYNVFPEVNHNGMTGFDVRDSTKTLSKKFYFIILKDKKDDPRILRRMDVLEKLYKDRDLSVESIKLDEKDTWYKIFSSLVLADWFAYYIAIEYGLDPEQVPMVEEFKKLI